MKRPYRIWTGSALPLRPGLFLTIALGIAAPWLYGQASVPDESQAGVMSALDQSTTYPIQTQMAETSNLNTVNENADTVKYSENALTRGPFFFSVETTVTGTTNLENTFDNQPSTTGAYFTVAFPLGIHLAAPTTDFSAYFRFDTNFYPGYSDLNHSSVIYSQQYIHQHSNLTTSSWSLAGGHIVTLGNYLSPVIGVGTTGVLAPQQSSGLQPLNDAATNYSIAHQMSERDTITASGMAGWIDQPSVTGIQTNEITSYRQLTGGGSVQWQRALNTREIAGVELSDVYIKGLFPSGMSNFTAAKLTFGQTLTPHSSITAGVGPLYLQSDLTGKPQLNNFTYTANVGFEYRRPFGDITGGFSRVYELGYVVPAGVANQWYFTFDHPITSKIRLAAASQYVLSPAWEGRNSYAQFVLTARLDVRLTPNLDYHVEGSSFIQDTGAPTPGYSNNQFSTGITFYFGNPLSRAGEQ